MEIQNQPIKLTDPSRLLNSDAYNYAALNVEEFGSVYEGLLEYDPQILDVDGRMEFSFVAGDDRASSGSHYTPDELVQPLIKHSLDYIIAEKLKEPNPEQALLSITVCDVACGSGHILLNAARRIATELAILRTGEDQPSPTAFRAAVRDVIRNCIYGVDLNPLAVELCKVSLWLEAHVPGEPLNFLDHHIKCGNAIVGLASREELQRGIPDEAFKTLPDDDKAVAAELRKQNKEERKGYQSLDFGGSPANDLDALRSEFSNVTKLSENTPDEIRKKQEAYDEFRRGIHLRNLKTLADVQVSQFYIPKTSETRRKITTHDQYRRYLRGENPHPEPTAYAQAITQRKRIFHWFLEFPDVFATGGFDCILGNPPYKGGTQLSGIYGHEFCEWVKYEYAPCGLSDLIVYFIRRFYSIIKANRFASFISTNSITDGDVRKDGLEQVIASGRNINFAVDSVKWPGRANVFVSLIAYVNGNWTGERLLDGRHVDYISAFLEDYEEVGDPHELGANEGSLYQGVDYLGEGFMLQPDEAKQLFFRDDRNRDVILPALNGQEFNNSISQKPGRFIINFLDWPESKARRYEDAFNIVEAIVKPERMAQKDQGAKERWWLLLRPRLELFKKLGSLNRCLVTAVTTKHMSFVMLPTGTVFLKTLKVLIYDEFWSFAVLQSGVHESWARKYSGSLETRLRYSNCFESFAFPRQSVRQSSLATLGETYHEHRRQLMLQMKLGLTKTYNLFHNSSLTLEQVAKASKQDAKVVAEAYSGLLQLRELHGEMDEAVLAAYGWHEPSDDGKPIELRHDFYEVDYLPESDRVRYTIHPDARREILKRLLLLNHKRYAEEVAAGKHGKSKTTKKKATKKKPAKAKQSGPSLFDGESSE